MKKALLISLALILGFSNMAMAENATMMEPPAGKYKKVSSLVKLPSFIPGLGSLYVDPASLPAGPFAAYDKAGHLVSSIYMIPLAQMNEKKKFASLAVAGSKTYSVDIYYNAGHPGVAEPHYHITVWHVDPATAKLK
jgi:hypothetical protein